MPTKRKTVKRDEFHPSHELKRLEAARVVVGAQLDAAVLAGDELRRRAWAYVDGLLTEREDRLAARAAVLEGATPTKSKSVKWTKAERIEVLAQELFAVLNLSAVEQGVVRGALVLAFDAGWEKRDDKAAEDSL